MPVTIQPARMKYKNSSSQFQSIDCLKGDKGDQGDPGETFPATPSSDGTYVFKRVVSSGTATDTWESLLPASGVSF